MIQRFIGTLLFACVLGVVSASAQTEYCFKNEGLKSAITISFALSGNKITDGEFETANYESDTSAEIYHFTGTKKGNLLTIKFARTVPEGLTKIKSIVWTLGKKSLAVPTYGKNYETKKYGVYIATYDKCAAN